MSDRDGSAPTEVECSVAVAHCRLHDRRVRVCYSKYRTRGGGVEVADWDMYVGSLTSDFVGMDGLPCGAPAGGCRRSGSIRLREGSSGEHQR